MMEVGRQVSRALPVWVGAVLLVATLVSPGAMDAQEGTAPPVPPAAPALDWDPNDPRIGLKAGWMDAGSAIMGLELVAAMPRPEGFVDPVDPGAGGFWNTDVAFKGDLLFKPHTLPFCGRGGLSTARSAGS